MTLWKVTAGGVRLTDELFTVRTPCGVRPRDRGTGGVADSANGSIPAFTPGHDNGALSGYGLMNRLCQLFWTALATAADPSGGDHGGEQGGAEADHGRTGRTVEDTAPRRVRPHLGHLGRYRQAIATITAAS